MKLASTPEPPYYAVIFTSIKNENIDEYAVIANRMLELVQEQPDFLGVESASGELGITISYWKSLESILNWKNNFEHIEAQKIGKERFYQSFKVRICKVEREYSFDKI